jgi:RND family efflux transporter MFP subunit
MKSGILFLSALIIITSCRERTTTGDKIEKVRVRTTPLTQQSFSVPVHSAGTLVSNDEVKLSFKTGGIISRVNVEEGQRVRKGELLAALDLSEIKAAVSQAENGYQKALRDYTRAENLYRDSVATLELRQNAETALDVAKSNRNVALFNLNHSSIIAPDNGIILKQLARPNELISAGYPVFLFGSAGKSPKVRTNLSDRDIVRISIGDSATVTFDAWPSVKFSAVVEQTAGISDPYTGTYETELSIDEKGYKLVSGFIADVMIYPASKSSYTMVPIGSIVEANGHNGYVYAVTDSSTVSKLKVDIVTLNGDMAAVSGLPGNITEVVSEGVAWLKDGMKVVVVK